MRSLLVSTTANGGTDVNSLCETALFGKELIKAETQVPL
jgi:hypothetical protein